jgi:hypothetical protein
MTTGGLVNYLMSRNLCFYSSLISEITGQWKLTCGMWAKRFIQAFRKEHPHLNVIATQDALSANGLHLKELQQAKLHYMIGVKA